MEMRLGSLDLHSQKISFDSLLTTRSIRNESIVVEDSTVTKAATATSDHTIIIGDTWRFV